jgi:WGR domain
VYNTFNVQRHLTSAQSHRVLRAAAMNTWREVVAAAWKSVPLIVRSRSSRANVTMPGAVLPVDINQCLESNQHDWFKLCVGRRTKPSRGFGMANVSAGDSPSLHIVLERVDPARNIARYYVLSIEPTLFGKHTLIRRWGRIGRLGLERLQFSGLKTRREPK